MKWIHLAQSIANPTVNSYKRINAAVTTSGATWSPSTISYGGNNRTHTIRIPDLGRFEFRLPDGAVNPYLLPAALMAAGIDGITQKRNPGARQDGNAYVDPTQNNQGKSLPNNLLDALRYFETNQILQRSLGENFVAAYCKLKHEEWHQYTAAITPWELETTLDC